MLPVPLTTDITSLTVGRCYQDQGGLWTAESHL